MSRCTIITIWRDLGGRLARSWCASWPRFVAPVGFEEPDRLRAIVFDRRHVRRNEVPESVMTSRPKLLLVFCPTLNRLHTCQKPSLFFWCVSRRKFSHPYSPLTI